MEGINKNLFCLSDLLQILELYCECVCTCVHMYVLSMHIYVCICILYIMCACLCVLVHKFNTKMLVDYCCVFGTGRNKGFNT